MKAPYRLRASADIHKERDLLGKLSGSERALPAKLEVG